MDRYKYPKIVILNSWGLFTGTKGEKVVLFGLSTGYKGEL
jgi:hypothetical protein